MYYKNVIRLLILGIIPLALLAYWNFIIYKYMKATPDVLRQCSNAQARIGEEKELAKVLIGIVVTFVCCHIIRISLNLYDAMVWKDIPQHCKEAGEGFFPSWVVIADNISQVMLSINSSVNIILYCCLNAKFRKKVFDIQRYFCSREDSSYRISIVRNRPRNDDLKENRRVQNNIVNNTGHENNEISSTFDTRQEYIQTSRPLYEDAILLTDFHV